MWYEVRKKGRLDERETSARSAPRLRIPTDQNRSDLSPPNRHCRCIGEALHSHECFKKWTINPNSEMLSTMNGLRPIQERTKDIIEARNYRLQLERDLKERRQKEIEDKQMEKETIGHKRKSKKSPEKLPEFGKSLEDQIKRQFRIEKDLLKLEEMKEMELLRIAMLKEEQLESSLVARLKQLSPYVRRSHYLDSDIMPTPTNLFRLPRHSRAMPTHPDSSPPPYFKTNDRVSPKAFSPKGKIRPQNTNKYLAELNKVDYSPDQTSTKRKKLPKTPRQLRQILQNNRQEIASFLQGVITRNL